MDSLFVTARKIADLGIWGRLDQRQFALKPKGVFPYFVTIIHPKNHLLVEASISILEGWQTFHDYMRFRLDHSYGFISSPIELPGWEFIFLKNGEVKVLRHDPCLIPVDVLTPHDTELLAKLIWETYGVCLRLETENRFLLRYADQNALFGRLEKDDHWVDAPFPIPPARPHVERIAIPKALFQKAKDLAFMKDTSLEVDFQLNPRVQTRDVKPRVAYDLIAVNEKGERRVEKRVSPRPETGLRALWEGMPPAFLRELVENLSYLPAEIKVGNARMFRMLRPLCLELPFKLSLHDKLDFIKNEL